MTYDKIHSFFKQSYNQNNWKQFLGEVFAKPQLFTKPEILTGIDSNVASQVLKLGYIMLNENGIERAIAVYEVTLAQGIILERNRVGLRNLLRKYWKDIDAAFITYHDAEKGNWRFTYVSELTGYDADGEFVKIKTEPKRYTYVLGEGESTRTAADRFTTIAAKRINTTLDDVKDAFSVEKLSKAFFDEYKKHYDHFCNFMIDNANIRQAIFNGDEKGIRDFNKKLLGRIVFLYFIQKKGWLGVPENSDWGNGDFDFLTNLFKTSKNQNMFYSELLSKLFFDTLNNSNRNNDLKELEKGKLYRIPYLNGGLFEEDDKKHRELIFPPELFNNLFNFFNQYNFTIYEDDPNDHTVAVDPEMLGHIFENLLEDNKDKGAFYTPKEIVHYMCQESLIEYLTTWFENKGYEVVGYTSLGNEHQPELFPINENRNGQLLIEVESLNTNPKIDRLLIEKLLKKKLDDNDKILITKHSTEFNIALDKVKICDPAIGSGAFPMGLLHEIFTAKQTIHTFEHGNTKTFDSSKVKRNIIQNSIYGVDIEKGAVDIARLRFWLSLIVDEETPKALLNLDYKIVVGNSLVSKFGENIIDIDWTLNETSHGFFGADLAKQKGNILKKISNEQKEFFNPESDKKKLAADIRNLKIDLLITQLELMVKTKGIEVEPKGTGKKIKEQIEIYLQTLGWLKSIKELKELKNKPELPLHFFDWKLDFPEVMNPLVYENNSSKIVVANAQILALNVQIDAINKHLLNSNIDSHLIHLQANIAQSQVEIIKEQLLILEKTIKDIFGIINPIDDNIVNEPDLSFTYKIASINKGIEGINQQIDNINLQIDKQNPNIGFDIVIGNPPYVLFNDISLIQNFKEKYKTANNGKINLYKIFIEKGIDLLKNVGLLYFINPNTYLSSKDSKILRELIINNTAIIEIIEFTEKDKVFENVAQAVTILGLKKEKVKNHIFKIKTAKQGLNYINQNDLRNLKDYHFISINKTISSILKTENNLNDFCEVFQGEINLTVKRDFFSENQSENKLPMLRGNNVGKYELVGNINEFCEIIADNRGHYKNERIVTQQVSNQSQKFRTKSLLIERNILCGNSTNYIILKESVHDCKLKFILALINSLTFNYYFNFFSSTNHLTCEELLFIPTPKASISIQNKIIKIVDKIHFIKSSNKDSVTSLEQEIDNIVYKLYELTYEEVKVIDPNFGLSEEEYKKLQIE